MEALDARRALQQKLADLSIVSTIYQEKCVLFGKASLLETAVATAQKLADQYPFLYWGVHPQVDGVLGLSQAITQLSQIPCQYFYAAGQRVFTYDPELQYSVPPQLSAASLEKAVTQSEYHHISRLLADFLKACAQYRADPYAVRKNCEHAIYLVMLKMERNYGQGTAISQKKLAYFQRIESAGSMNELCDILEDILSDLSFPDTPHTESNAQLLEQIDAFMKQNYMKPLHLSDLAKHVHLSYHYLSRILKSTRNESFNDYLNRVRVNAACRLLTSTSQDLSHIAEEVGFTDQSYFGKIFKKITGYSPRLYRMKYTKGT